MRCNLVGGYESFKCSHSDECAVRFGQERGSNVSKASSTEMGPLKSQVTACRTVAKVAVKQLRPGAETTGSFLLQHQIQTLQSNTMERVG
jgi:hypothetical protein